MPCPWETEPYSVELSNDETGWTIVFDRNVMTMRYQAKETAEIVAELMNMAFREGKRCARQRPD